MIISLGHFGSFWVHLLSWWAHLGSCWVHPGSGSMEIHAETVALIKFITSVERSSEGASEASDRASEQGELQ